MTPVLRSEAQTLKIFGVQTGSFGYIENSTQVAMLDAIIDYVLLLLAW